MSHQPNHGYWRRHLCFVGLLLALLSLTGRVAAEDVDEIHWVISQLPGVHELPEAGRPPGFGDRILNELLIPALPEFRHRVSWVPAARRNMILATENNACTPDVLRSPEREAFAVFSTPLLAVLPMGIFALTNTRDKIQPFVNEHGTLSLTRLLKEQDIRLGIGVGRAYGTALDTLFANHTTGHVAKVATSEPIKNLAKMMGAGRLDGILAFPHEATFIQSTLPPPNEPLLFWNIAELNKLQWLYVACRANAEGKTHLAKIQNLLDHSNTANNAQELYATLLSPSGRKLLQRNLKNK